MRGERCLLRVVLFLVCALTSRAQTDSRASALCAQAAGIAQTLTRISGMPLKHPVPCDYISKEKIKEFLDKRVKEVAKPDEIRFTDSLPKTRSGKIMRRLLRDLASGQKPTGDTTTLEDFSVLAKLKEEEE